MNHMHTCIYTINHFYGTNQIWHSFVPRSGVRIFKALAQFWAATWCSQLGGSRVKALFTGLWPDTSRFSLRNMEKTTSISSPFISGLIKKNAQSSVATLPSAETTKVALMWWWLVVWLWCKNKITIKLLVNLLLYFQVWLLLWTPRSCISFLLECLLRLTLDSRPLKLVLTPVILISISIIIIHLLAHSVSFDKCIQAVL